MSGFFLILEGDEVTSKATLEELLQVVLTEVRFSNPPFKGICSHVDEWRTGMSALL